MRSYDELAAAMRALDPTETIERLAANDRAVAEIDAAIARADDEIRSILDKEQAASRFGTDFNAAADALMAGGDAIAAAQAVKSPDDFAEERKALSKGRSILRQRRNDQMEGRRHIIESFAGTFSEIGDLLFEEFLAEARELVTRLASLYGNLRAVQAATGGRQIASLAERLKGGVAILAQNESGGVKLIEACLAHYEGIGRQIATVSLDPELLEALAQGQHAIAVTRWRLISVVPLPQFEPEAENSFLLGMAAGRRPA